jgi:phage-related minor tail protein
LKDGLKGIFKDMSDYFISMVSKMAMNWLFFENIQGGGKFLGGGSGLGSIVGWIGSLLKFGEGGVTLGWKPMKAFQEGGVAYGPTLGMIGEGGPEAFVPLKGGRIPVEMAGGGNTIIVHNYITNIKAMDTISARDFVQRNPGPFIEVISSDLGDKGSTYQALTRRRQ